MSESKFGLMFIILLVIIVCIAVLIASWRLEITDRSRIIIAVLTLASNTVIGTFAYLRGEIVGAAKNGASITAVDQAHVALTAEIDKK